MFATSVRVRPWRARSSPRSVGRLTRSSPSPCSIAIRCGTDCCSVPRGPATITRPGSSDTLTPAGTGIGCFPMRLIALPDEADHFAAHATLGGGAARDQPVRGGQDRDTHAAEHARQAVLLRV